jgi:hypothetical protein
MHKKYAKDGLVAITVSVDSLKPEDDKTTAQDYEKKVIKKVKDELKTQQANFPALILDLREEEDENVFLEKKLRFNGPPALFVFNREGKWTKFTPNDTTKNPAKKYKNAEEMNRGIAQLVEQLMNKK